jgi:hypothetical protein
VGGRLGLSKGPTTLQRAWKVLLLVIVAGAGSLLGGLYVHRYYALQPFQTAPIGTAESNTDDLRYRLHTELSTSDKQHLLDGDCQVVTSADAFPQPIKNAFATVTQDKPFSLANPGTRFNATDVIEPDLPQRRLVFAGVCKDLWLIQYEHGGIGLSVQVMVLNMESNNDVHFVWGGERNRPVPNLIDLRYAIVSGKFSDSDRF